MNEIWKPVPGYEGFYEASDLGRVRSLPRTFVDKLGRQGRWPGKLLTQRLSEWGYRVVWMSIKGSPKLKKVHRVVGITFIENPQSLPEINHKDGDKSNNRPGNLEWTTSSGNFAHGIATGLIGRPRGEQVWASKMTEQTVIELRSLRAQGQKLKQLAAKYGINEAAVSAIATRRRWKHI